jgi:hypothetical protein
LSKKVTFQSPQPLFDLQPGFLLHKERDRKRYLASLPSFCICLYSESFSLGIQEG